MITICLFEIRLVWFLRMAIALFSSLWIGSNQTLAQVTPDRTLGAESSVVNPNQIIRGLPSDLIQGGAERGANLFHSFLDFNVAAGRGVYFNNPAGVENILSRVTGGNLSRIDGRLGVLGSANLFLLNPNGILFGPNASLDVAGSFLASTANSLRFTDGTEYSATNPDASSLLTVSVPLGVQFGREQPQAIANAGNLTVGQDLILIGGTVVSTGQLNAPEGNLRIAAVPAGAGVNVSPEEPLTVNLPTDLPTPITTTTSAASPGSITVGDIRAGDEGSVEINAQGDISTDTIQTFVGDGGSGNGGEITLTSRNGSITTGGSLNASSTDGSGGKITLDAAGNITTGGSLNASSTGVSLSENKSTGGEITLTSRTGSINTVAGELNSTAVDGNSGNIQLSAALDVNTADIKTSILIGREGTGIIGNIDITSSAGNIDTTQGNLSAASDNGTPSGTVALTGAGNISLGNITVSSKIPESSDFDFTGSIRIESKNGSIYLDGKTLEATNSSDGITGDIALQAFQDIVLTNNSQVLVKGTLGFIEMTTPPTGRVLLNGSSVNASVNPISTTTRSGQAGDIEITTGTLRIENKSNVEVNSPESLAGNLIISANSVLLNQSTISANTGQIQSEEDFGANIFLLGYLDQAARARFEGPSSDLTILTELESYPALKFLILQNGSRITTNATSTAKGGNIFINTQVLLATGTRNKIQANAAQGTGGAVFIVGKPLGIYNIDFRQFETRLLNDITVTSNIGDTGIVEIALPDINPSRGLNQLPADTTDASRRINPICPIAGQQSAANQFVVTGRGGLPATPNTALSSSVLVGESSPVVTQSDLPSGLSANATETPPSVEAQGVTIGAHGEFILTAHPDGVSPHSSWQPFPNCNSQ